MNHSEHRAAAVLAVWALAVLSGGPAWGGAFEFAYHEPENMRETFGRVGGQQVKRARTIRGSSGRICSGLAGEPAYRSKQPLHFWVELAECRFAVALDQSEPDRDGYDTMYADVNRNRDLRDDVPFESGLREVGQRVSSRRGGRVRVAKWVSHESVFGPVKVMLADGRPYRFTVTCRTKPDRSWIHGTLEGIVDGRPEQMTVPYIYVESACCYLGKVTLSGSDYRAAVLDGRGNAVFLGKDARLAIDLDQSGRFDHESFEVVRLWERMVVGDRLYRVSLTQGGRRIRFEEIPVALGRVRNSNKNFRLILKRGEGLLEASSPAHDTMVAAGAYELVKYEQRQTDQTGRVWRVYKYFDERSPYRLDVDEDGVSQVDLGPPLLVTVGVAERFSRYGSWTPAPRAEVAAELREYRARAGETIELRIHSVDRAGREWPLGCFQNGGRRPDEPRAVILSASGSVLHTAKFEYG